MSDVIPSPRRGKNCFIFTKLLHPVSRRLVTVPLFVCRNGVSYSVKMIKRKLLSLYGIANYRDYDVYLMEQNSNRILPEDQPISNFMPLSESSCLMFNQRYVQETMRQDDDHSLMGQVPCRGRRRRRARRREATVELIVLNPTNNNLQMCEIVLCRGGMACTVAQTKELLLRTFSICHNFDRYHLAVHVTNASFLLADNDLTFPYMYLEDDGFYLSFTTVA
ncbi:uncharacterized protein LOC131940483 [Physella acuta]|uniref:uncharacterized protein LOC131940483 n=1 Tax=Physella acuta TaxID=109671 RepID=UPI0027DB9CF9|nr:uncharacterized protein LOC131940483 [Physella acuta]